MRYGHSRRSSTRAIALQPIPTPNHVRNRLPPPTSCFLSSRTWPTCARAARTDLFDLAGRGQGLLPRGLGHLVTEYGRDMMPPRDAAYPPRRFPNRISYLGFGDGFSGLDFHTHKSAASWAVQIFGRKLWLMAPPNCSASWLHARYPPQLAGQRKIAERLGTPTARGASDGCAVTWCVQLPGDVVHVPPVWWHATWNLDVAVSIATQIDVHSTAPVPLRQRDRVIF